MSDRVTSPITGNEADIIDYLDPEILTKRYMDEWGLDVASVFRGIDQVQLYKCHETGYRFFHPERLAAEEKIYDQINSEEFEVRNGGALEWKEDWQFGLSLIEPGDRILDVGCSDGGFLVRAGTVGTALGIEGNAISSERARKRGLNVTTGHVGDFLQDHTEEFDKVFAFQVLEHVYDVRRFVTDLLHLLKPHGKLIFVVPNSDPYFAAWGKYDPLNNPPHHIGLWNESSLRGLGEALGIEIELISLLGGGGTFVQSVYRRASLLARVYSPVRRHSLGEWLRIALAAPVAFTLTSLGRRRHAGNIAVVYRKP